MTTLQNLIDKVEADLADSANATWAAADIEQWLRDAIADYSQHLPRQLTGDISTTAAGKKYDLNAGFIEPVSVEYPEGEEPAEYLQRRPYTHINFWSQDGYYDIVPRADDAAVNEIYISTSPADSETIRVIYQATHDNTIAAGGTVTVPARHHHILRAYARWKATLQQAATEEAGPTSNSSLLMSQFAANARRWEREYLNALAKAIQAEQGKSQVVSWAERTEEGMRIY
jgi:hypothetical protein